MSLLAKDDELDLLTRPVTLPRVNLLPPEIGEARRFRRVQGGLAGAVVASVAVVGLLYAGASAGVSDASAERDQAATTQRTLQSSAAQYRDVTATYTRATDAQALLTTAMGQEVRGMLNYYASQPGAPRIGRVVLSGGGSLLGGLVERLGYATRLPVELARPMSVLTMGRTGLTDEQLQHVEPVVTVPVGLALGVAS